FYLIFSLTLNRAWFLHLFEFISFNNRAVKLDTFSGKQQVFSGVALGVPAVFMIQFITSSACVYVISYLTDKVSNNRDER
ncbi:hypothetical protein, partial [Fervidicoccus fontis]|uniref:hypothetical protein n=1 Tax=Fervidicoccus fontis TaxID=683846 RepID=UPI00235306E8